MTTLTLGEVKLTRVIEIPRSTFPTTQMLPGSTAEGVARHHDWLKPHFWDASTDDLGSRIGTWIVRTPEHLVLIDTGVGNDKSRESNPLWHRRQGTFLDDLDAAGVTPEQVDIVVITHMHVDHVGWNTRLVDGKWEPTFPNARYVFAGEEWQFWKHENERGGDEYGCIDDSVLPIVASGQAALVDDTHEIDRWLRFEPSIGHTPGHVSVRLGTTAGEAVFSGDLMHRVVQVAEPQWSSRFCYDGAQAAKTRREFVERHADSGVLILAAHFPRPGVIVRGDGGFRFQPLPATES
jgi:glyoxylase-like metal-dependent hydrolase (beta-lactamase superfamily II)